MLFEYARFESFVIALIFVEKFILLNLEWMKMKNINNEIKNEIIIINLLVNVLILNSR